MRLICLFLAFTIVLGAPKFVAADSAPPRCEVEPKHWFSSAEVWAWNVICDGGYAIMKPLEEKPKEPQHMVRYPTIAPQCTTNSKSWIDKPVSPHGPNLSGRFIEVILTDPALARRLGGRPIRIGCAVVKGPVIVTGTKIDRSVVLWKSIFESTLNLSGSKFDGYITISASHFSENVDFEDVIAQDIFSRNIIVAEEISFGYVEIRGDIVLNYVNARKIDVASAKVGGSLYLNDVISDEVNINASSISGFVTLNNSVVEGKIGASGIRTGANALFGGVSAKELDIGDAWIGRNLALSRAKISDVRAVRIHTVAGIYAHNRGGKGTVIGSLSFRDADIGTDIDFEGSQIYTISMNGAKLGDTFLADGAEIGKIDAERAIISGSFFLRNASLFDKINLSGAKVGSNFNIDGAYLGDVTLSGATVQGSIFARAVIIPGEFLMENTQVGNGFTASNLEDSGGHIGGLRMSQSTIGGLTELQGLTLGDVDLSHTTLQKGLRLHKKGIVPVWREGSVLDMTHAAMPVLFAQFPASFVTADYSRKPHTPRNAHTFELVTGTQNEPGDIVTYRYPDFYINTANCAYEWAYSEERELVLTERDLPLRGTGCSTLPTMIHAPVNQSKLVAMRRNGVEIGQIDGEFDQEVTSPDRHKEMNECSFDTGIVFDATQTCNSQEAIEPRLVSQKVKDLDVKEIVRWIEAPSHPAKAVVLVEVDQDGVPLASEDEGTVAQSEGVSQSHHAFYQPAIYRTIETALKKAGRNFEAKRIATYRTSHWYKSLPDDTWIQWFLKLTVIWFGFHLWAILTWWGAFTWVAGIWFVLLVLAGMKTAVWSPSTYLKNSKPSHRFWYSLENTLPLIDASADHQKVTHHPTETQLNEMLEKDRSSVERQANFVSGFFHAQKIIGFLLATVLVATITFN